MNLSTYTYEQYKAVHKSTNGKTTHFWPVLGTRDTRYTLLQESEFDEKLSRLKEIKSHDDDWYMEQEYYIDVMENEMYESFYLSSELFVIEIEQSEKVMNSLEH